MTWWSDWLLYVRGETDPPHGIDLGNGRVLGAEDVLEGHYRRLTATRPRQRRASVQVGDNLMAAITVLAPDLAPLTELAEEVAGAVPPVQPAVEFRRHLHQALERTHRQHAAQRALGTRRPYAPERESRPLWWIIMALAVLVVMGGIWRWWGRREAAAQAVA
jgi:hypothetical protein